MQLNAIERVVLNNIGLRYDELSISTDPKEMLDFVMLHTCINLAREEIKLNTKFPALNMFGTGIVTVANNSQYSLPVDFDIPIDFYFWSNGMSDAVLLKQMYVESLPGTVPVAIGTATLPSGTPDSYIIAGTSADLIQIYLYPTPQSAGIILPLYKPVLTELSLATAEDVIIRKYPKAVIDFATAFAWQILKKDPAQHDKYYGLGLSECFKIDLREMKADSNYKEYPDALMMARRAGRLSK